MAELRYQFPYPTTLYCKDARRRNPGFGVYTWDLISLCQLCGLGQGLLPLGPSFLICKIRIIMPSCGAVHQRIRGNVCKLHRRLINRNYHSWWVQVDLFVPPSRNSEWRLQCLKEDSWSLAQSPLPCAISTKRGQGTQFCNFRGQFYVDELSGD